MTFAIVVAWATLLLWVALAGLVRWCRPPRPLRPFGLWITFSGLLWSLGELGTSFLSASAATHWLFIVVLYTGVLLNVPLWWALCLSVAAHHDARPRWAGPAVQYGPFALASLCWLALVTNPWHGQFLLPNRGSGRNDYRAIWYVQASYGYLLMVASLVLIAWVWRRQKKGESGRTQLAILFWASLMPLTANFVHISRLVPLGFDPTQIGFAVALGLIFFGIFRKRLFAVSGLTLDHWMDHDQDGVAILDAEGNLVHANPAAQWLLDVEPLKAGEDFVRVLAERVSEEKGAQRESVSAPPPPLTPSRDSLWAVLLAADPPPEGILFRLRGDRRRWLRVHCTRIPGRWPSTNGVGLRLRDDTQLVETSERAARQAASIEAILGSIRDGLFVADESGRLVYANERFWEMWHLREVVDRHVDEASLLEELAARTASGGSLTDTEEGADVVLKSGEVFSFAKAPLVRRQKRVGRVWTFRDVTERRKAELEREQLEERIRESQKLESLGVLAGGVAHDFNNILVGILGNVDLAANAVEPMEPVYRYLTAIRSSADRAAELIQQILAYAGRGQLAVTTVDLSALVEETKNLVRSAISKKADLHTRLEPGIFVEGDPVQLRQIVMNLLTNASDALGDAAGTITVRTGRRLVEPRDLDDALPISAPSTGPYAFLSISDTGCGMDAQTMGRIFEPFFSTKFTGRGLGLSAALGIMRTHRGLVKVSSAPGKGSTFQLLFPLATAPPATLGTDRLLPEARLRSTPATVLVVDDEEVVREVARAALEMEGYRVLLAKDGQECVSLFRENASGIEAIVLDMTMPRMDGAEALFAVRQISRDVPVVLSSGYSEQDTMARCSGLSGVTFIQKPYTSERLLGKVSEAVRSRPMVAATASSSRTR